MLNEDCTLNDDGVRALQGAALAGLSHLLPVEAAVVEAVLHAAARQRPTAMISVAMLALTRRQVDEAIRHLRNAHRALPGAPSIRALLMRALYEVDNPEWKQHARELLRQKVSGAALNILQATLADAGPATERALRSAAAGGVQPALPRGWGAVAAAAV